MKMKFIKTVDTPKWMEDIYENNFYRLSIRKGEFVSSYRVSIIATDTTYLPNIFIDENFENFLANDVTISAASYGSLKIREMEKVIYSLNIAMASAKEIEEILKQNNLFNMKK